ncbi:beta-propeller fold lactonase family protein [Streptomyces sp. NPDC056517]|uniref:beta-propeller fold lactonase family protein n=1 Tax=unclassified Streptomyces TaxID=2593676 RepID=UPI0036B216DD
MAGPVPRPICESVDVHGETPTQLAVAGGHLLTANYGSASVTVLPLAAASTPQAAGDVLRHEGRGPDSARQLGPHAHQVLPDPSGRWVLSVDLGTRSPRHTRIQSTHPAGRSTDTPVVRRGPAGSRRRGRFRWPGAGGRASSIDVGADVAADLLLTPDGGEGGGLLDRVYVSWSPPS